MNKHGIHPSNLICFIWDILQKYILNKWRNIYIYYILYIYYTKTTSLANFSWVVYISRCMGQKKNIYKPRVKPAFVAEKWGLESTQMWDGLSKSFPSTEVWNFTSNIIESSEHRFINLNQFKVVFLILQQPSILPFLLNRFLHQDRCQVGTSSHTSSMPNPVEKPQSCAILDDFPLMVTMSCMWRCYLVAYQRLLLTPNSWSLKSLCFIPSGKLT